MTMMVSMATVFKVEFHLEPNSFSIGSSLECVLTICKFSHTYIDNGYGMSRTGDFVFPHKKVIILKKLYGLETSPNYVTL